MYSSDEHPSSSLLKDNFTEPLRHGFVLFCLYTTLYIVQKGIKLFTVHTSLMPLMLPGDPPRDLVNSWTDPT